MKQWYSFRGKIMDLKSYIAASFLSIVAATGAHSASISYTADPLLSGASVITFDEVSNGTVNPVIGDVSFTAHSGSVRTLTGACASPCLPEITGARLGNQSSGGSGSSINILFGTAVSAFGIHVGAINSETTLVAFGATNNFLGTTSFGSSCCGAVFRGLGGFGESISWARIVTLDYVVADNLHYVPASVAPIPVPAAGFLLVGALGGLGLMRRRKRS